MNNDLTRELNKCINLSKNINFSGKSCHVDSQCDEEKILPENKQSNIEDSDSKNNSNLSSNDIDMEKSMNFMLGKAQINSKNHEASFETKKSVEEFLSNPDFIEAHNDLTDELVKKGYSLEEALIKTDIIFESLKNREIYQS